MPINGVSTERIEERAEAFFERGKALCNSNAFSHLTFLTSLQAFRVVAETYFYLNVAYKGERIPVNSKTKPSKVAAMTALSIGVVKPIRPPSQNINDEEYAYVNGILALRIATTLVGHNFDKRPFDDKRRSYKMIQGFEFTSLRPLLDEANVNNGVLSTNFTPELDEDELSKIDAQVEAFSLMARLGDHDASFR